jgi:hypothetical protein
MGSCSSALHRLHQAFLDRMLRTHAGQPGTPTPATPDEQPRR